VNAESTALGASYLAGLAVGYWPDEQSIAGQWAIDRRFTPQIDVQERRARQDGWRGAVERARNWEAR